MTIPSRPAPPPPQQQGQRQNVGVSRIAIKLPPPPTSSSSINILNCRQSPSTDNGKVDRTSSFTDTLTNISPLVENKTNYGSFNSNSGITKTKKIPPPRPPPPKIGLNNPKSGAVLKKPGPPQSVNVLSSIFGRKKSAQRKILLASKINQNQGAIGQQSLLYNTNSGQNGDVQLISFDSPPSSPTFTQKSNSDCVSVDSFSSDSNFSSPNNGSTPQPESGFEDDFISPVDPWEAISNTNNNLFGTKKNPVLNELKITQPVRNLRAINNIKPDDILNNGKSLLPPTPTLSMPTIIRSKLNQNCSQISRNSSLVSNAERKSPAILNPCLNVSDENQQDETVTDNIIDDSPPSPPMPSCPPPPPPILLEMDSDILDVVKGNIDALNLADNDEVEANGPSYGIALYDFEGIEDGDLSFKQGDKIYLLKRLNAEWYSGRNRSGCEGIFPSNYIEIKVPLRESISPIENYANDTIASSDIQNTNNSNYKGRALYKFIAETSTDLSLNKNDIVTILYKINDDWLYGEISNRRGQFPANFIEYIP